MDKKPKDLTLQISSLGKQYRLGKIGTGSLSGDLRRKLSMWRGEQDPAMPVNFDGSDRSLYGDIWALRGVNIEIGKGEVVGLIGKNGAGKSTLLKLLSQVTAPTEGTIRIKGRVSSLLEVGTGMHPELTGKENIFLNGALLGMTKAEVEKKFDEIVAFSGCENFINTPVKRYSSGMKVRLGFSVAAFMEPEILIVDEVLAVGDAEFRKKAVARMKEVSSGGDRTVIFVSHNMTSVRSLCTRCIYLKDGRVAYDGDVADCIAEYLGFEGKGSIKSYTWPDPRDAPSGEGVRMVSAQAVSPGRAYGEPFSTDMETIFEIEAERTDPDMPLDCTLRIFSESGDFLAASGTLFFSEREEKDRVKGKRVRFTCRIPPDFFNQGLYRFGVLLVADRQRAVMRLDELFEITYTTAPRDTDGWMGTPAAHLMPRFEWKAEPGKEEN